MAGLFTKIRTIITILKVYYLFPFIATLKSFVRFRESDVAHREWSKISFEYFQVKLQELSGSKKRKEGKIMFLGNHRCQGDFFLHNTLLDFQANVLSRMAVAILIPNFLVAYKTLWFFNRSGNINPEKFNEWLDSKFKDSCRPGLLAYPEGHRMQGIFKVDKKKLKTGMIRYAYRRKMPTQIFMSFGNEDCFDEKRIHVSWGQTIYYKFADVIDPNDFEDENKFVEKIKDKFCEFFDQAHEDYRKAKETEIQKASL